MNNDPTRRSPAQQAAIDTAQQAVRTIDALRVNEDFRRFMDRFQARADQLADLILHKNMKSKEREKLRNHRLGILEVLAAPKEDRAAQVKVLTEYGIAPADPRQ